MLKNNNERCIELDDGNEDATTNNNKNIPSSMNDVTAITTVHTKIGPSIHLAPLSTLISTPSAAFSPPVLFVVDDDELGELAMESSETLGSESRLNSVSDAASVSGPSTSTRKALNKDQTNMTNNQQQQNKLIKVAGPQRQQRQLSLQEKKSLRQQNPVEKIFPHISMTHQKLRILLARPIGNTLQQQLMKVINAYIAGCRNEYEEGTSSPYKCRRLAHSMTRTMDLMQQLCASFEDTPEYIHRMIELVSIYLSCELRYAKEFKEHKPPIANRILHNIYKYLKGSNKDETMTYILGMFAHMPRLYREREVMTKVFQTLIPKEQVILQRELPDKLYIQYIIVFYHWKQLELNLEEQMRVIEFANAFMRPAKTLGTNSTYAYHLPKYACPQMATKFILHDLKFFHDLRNASIYDHRLQLGPEVIDISDEEPKISKTTVNINFAELVQYAVIQPTTRPMIKLENQIVIATIDLTLEDERADDSEWLQELQRNAKKLEPARNVLSLAAGRNLTLPNDNFAAKSEVIEIDSDTEGEEDNDELEEPENLLLEEPEQLSDNFLDFEEPDQDDNLSDNSLEEENPITMKTNENTDHIEPTKAEINNDASSIPFSQQLTQVFPTKLNIISVRSIAATQTEKNSNDCSVPHKSKVMPELLPTKPYITEIRAIAATQTESSFFESATENSADATTQLLPSKPTIIEVRSIARNQSTDNNNCTPVATSTELEVTQINPQISKTLNADLVTESGKQAVSSLRNDIRVSRIDDSYSCRRESLHLLSSPVRNSRNSNDANNDTFVHRDIDTNDIGDDDVENEMCFFGNSRMGSKTTVDTHPFVSNKVIYSVAASTCPPLQPESTDFASEDESLNIKQQNPTRNSSSQKKGVQFSNKPLQRTGGNPITHPIKPAIKNTNSTYNNQHTPINSAVSRFGSASPALSTSSHSRTFQKENKTDTDNLIISTQPTSNSLKLSSNETQNDSSNMSVLNNDGIVKENQVVSNNNNQLVENIAKENLILTQAVDISSTNVNELSVTSTCDELCAASQDVTANTETAVTEDVADSQQLDDVVAEQTNKEPLDIEDEIATAVAASNSNSNSPKTSINWQEEDKNNYYDLEEFLILHKRRESQDIADGNHNNVCNVATNSNTNTSNNDCDLDSDLEFDFDFVFGLDFDAMTPTTAATVAAATATTPSMHISTTFKYVDGYNVEADKLLEQFNVATENIVETVLSTNELQEPPISSPTLTSTCTNNKVITFSADKRNSAISSTTSSASLPESLSIKGANSDDIEDEEDNIELPLELDNELLINADDDLLPASELITDAELLKEFVTIPTMTSKSPKPKPEIKDQNKLVDVDVDTSDLLREYVTNPAIDKKFKKIKEPALGKGRNLPKTEDLLKELVANASNTSAHKTEEEEDEEELCELKNLSESSLGASNDVLVNAELLQEFVMIPTLSTKTAKPSFEQSNKKIDTSNNEIEDDTDLLQVFDTIPKIKAKAPELLLATDSIDVSETLTAEETIGTSEEISISGPESSHFEESLDEAYAMSRRVLMRNLMSATNCSAFADPQQVEITLPLKKRRKISEFQDELETNSNAAATLTEEEEEDEPTAKIVEKNIIKTASFAVDTSNTPTVLSFMQSSTVSKQAPELAEVDLPKVNDIELTKPLEATSNSSVLNPQPSSATQPKPILLPTNSSPPQNKQVQIVAPQIKELIKPIDAIASSNLQVLLTPLAESYPAEPMLSIANFENLVHLQRYLDTLVTSTHISKIIDAALAVTHIFQEFSGQGSHSTLIATIEKLLSTPSSTAAPEETAGLATAGDNGKLLLKIHLEGSISILVDNNNVSEWMKLPPATAALLTKAAKSLSKWEKYKQQQIEQNKLLCEQFNSTKPVTESGDDNDEQILEIRAHDLINKMLPGQRNVPLPKKENMLFDLQMAEIRIKQQQKQKQNDAPNIAITNFKDTQNIPMTILNFKDTPNVATNTTSFKEVQTVAVAPLEPSLQQQALTETSSPTTSSAVATPAPTSAPTSAPDILSNLSNAINPIATITNAQPIKDQHQFVDQHVAKIIEAQKLFNSIDQNKNTHNSIGDQQKNIAKDLENMNMLYYDDNNTSSSKSEFLAVAKHMTQYAADEMRALNPANRNLVNLNCPSRTLSATQLLKHAAQLNSTKYLRHNSSGGEESEKVTDASVSVMQSLLQQQNDLFQHYNSNNYCTEQQQQQQAQIASSYQEIYQHTQAYVQSSSFANLQQQMQFPPLLQSPSMLESTVEAAETIDISQLKLPYTKAGDYQSLKNTTSPENIPGEFQSTIEQQQQQQQQQRHLMMAEKCKQFEEIIKQRNIVLQQQRQQQREFEKQQRRSLDYEALHLNYKNDLMMKSNKEQHQRLNPHRERYMQQQQLEYEKLHNKAKNDFEELQRKKLQYEWLQEFTARQQQQQQQKQQKQQQHQQFQQQLTASSSVSTSSNASTMSPTETSAEMAAKRRRLEECHSNNLTLNMITDMNQTAKSIADRGTQNILAAPPPKRRRGRPRKYPLATEVTTMTKPLPTSRGKGRSSRCNNKNSAAAKFIATTAPTPPTTLASNMLRYPPSKAINTNANSTTKATTLYNPYAGIFSAPVNFTAPQLSPKMTTDLSSSLDVPPMISTSVDIMPLSQNI